MMGLPEIKMREVIVVIIFIPPLTPFLILEAITFGKIKGLEWLVNSYGKYIVQPVMKWINKF